MGETIEGSRSACAGAVRMVRVTARRYPANKTQVTMNAAITANVIAWINSPDSIGGTLSSRWLSDTAAGCTVHPHPALFRPVRTMSKPNTRENRLLPGWARVVLMVWGIAGLLWVLQLVAIAAFGLFFG